MLDTCLGRPAPGVPVTLERLAPGSSAAWERIASGATNADGRCPDLLPPSSSVPLQPGRYRISWDVAEYQACCAAAHPDFFATPAGPATRRFYPAAAVEFEVQAHQVWAGGWWVGWGGLGECRRDSRAPAQQRGGGSELRKSTGNRPHSTASCSPAPVLRWVQSREHFHVPLTWNPFGYSTYRGS